MLNQYRPVPDDGFLVMTQAADILEAVNQTDMLATEEALATRDAYRESLDPGQQTRASMDKECARAMVDGLRAWGRMGRVSPDLMNRVGGFQMYQLADRIVTGGIK